MIINKETSMSHTFHNIEKLFKKVKENWKVEFEF